MNYLDLANSGDVPGKGIPLSKGIPLCKGIHLLGWHAPKKVQKEVQKEVQAFYPKLVENRPGKVNTLSFMGTFTRS
jgi:hypothetical protein